MPLLRLEALSKKFGDIWALKELDFSIEEGEIVGLVGPNGAGKTTLVNLITGRHKPTGGRVLFAGRETTSCKPHVTRRLGISRTFQSSRPFAKMTALENVVAGRIFSREIHFFTRQTDIATAEKLLELVGIAHKANTLGGDLTLSEQRRLDLARALANQPRLLILDEVAAGFSPVAVKQAVELVRRVRQQGVTLFIIDHFLTLSLRVSDRMLALDQGEKVAEGSPQQVMRNRGVISAYLGMRHEDEQQNG